MEIEKKLFSIPGWIQMYETNPVRAELLRRSCNYFLKAFCAEESPHRSTKHMVSNSDGDLVSSAYIAFSFKGDYQSCQAFRDALVKFCSIYGLTLDRGLEIYLIEDK